MAATDKDTESGKALLPTLFVDPHHHFFDSTEDSQGKAFNKFFASVAPNLKYSPSDYDNDVVKPLTQELGIQFLGSVHLEVISDDGLAEAKWVESLIEEDGNKCTVKAAVASCDLTRPPETIHKRLAEMKQGCPLIRGIRWILDVSDENDQEYVPNTATHISTKRHDATEFGTIDYLKVPAFESGIACLESYQYTFDLQCAPTQLKLAAAIFAKYPNIPVCLDHLGKLRNAFDAVEEEKQSNQSSPPTLNEAAVQVWKDGMQAIAKLPHVYCKLSCIGFAVPGWHASEKGRDVVRQLLHFVVMDCFGPERCLAALNWHVNASVSDSDGECPIGPSPVEYVQLLSELLPSELTLDQRNDIFAHNACRFYRITT